MPFPLLKYGEIANSSEYSYLFRENNPKICTFQTFLREKSMDQLVAVGGIYLVPALAVMSLYWGLQWRKARRARAIFSASQDAGLLEPASLHPLIDNTRCLGCATCISACPEKQVLGLVDNRAKLIEPASCIGHGACHDSCPNQAIQLVFGTESRGVDIPHIDSQFQTNIEGIYIAGELGGMGLIRKAIEQGRQAVEFIAKNSRCNRDKQLDVVIIGAGPAGISAAMAASEKGLTYRLLEQDTIGGTIAHYPRGKIVMTAPATLPLIGEFQFQKTTKENLMAFWEDVVERTGLNVATGVTVETILPTPTGFEIQSSQPCTASNVLLAIGRRGTPRKLGVPGEDRSKVVYRLVDPEQYRGQKVMVVGGGDSALEASLSLAQEPGTQVLLSYRSEAFSRAKAKNRDRIQQAANTGKLRLELGSQVVQINKNCVDLQTLTGSESIENDAVIVCAGGTLPSPFLRTMGIEVETRFGTA